MRESVSIGYIHGKQRPETFPVSRTIYVHVYSDQKQYYFRTQDIALLIDEKQPFYFTKKIRDAIGVSAVLSGKQTESFRQKNSPRVTFISAKDLHRYLASWPDRYADILSALELYF